MAKGKYLRYECALVLLLIVLCGHVNAQYPYEQHLLTGYDKFEYGTPKDGIRSQTVKEYVAPKHGSFSTVKRIGDYVYLYHNGTKKEGNSISALCVALSDSALEGPCALYLDCFAVVAPAMPVVVNSIELDYSKLEHIELFCCKSSSADIRIYNKMTNLQYVGLPYDSTDDIFIALSNLKTISAISACSTKIRGDGLRHLSRLPELRYLDIRFLSFSSGTLQNLEGLRSLNTLLLSYTNIRSSDLKHIQPLQHLEYLSLHNTAVDDDAVEYICSIKGLEHVTLYNTRVSSEGVGRILKNNRNLRIERHAPLLIRERYDAKVHIDALQGGTYEMLELARKYSTDTNRDVVEALKWYIIARASYNDLKDEERSLIDQEMVQLKREINSHENREARLRANAVLFVQRRSIALKDTDIIWPRFTYKIDKTIRK